MFLDLFSTEIQSPPHVAQGSAILKVGSKEGLGLALIVFVESQTFKPFQRVPHYCHDFCVLFFFQVEACAATLSTYCIFCHVTILRTQSHDVWYSCVLKSW